MRSKISRLWGTGLALMLIAGLFIAAAPASGDTLRWSVLNTPQGVGLTWQVAPGTDVQCVKVAPNGEIFAVDTQANPDVVYRSVDYGNTWTPSTAIGAAADSVVDLAVSPSYTTDVTIFAAVVIAGGATSRVYISTNAGVSFNVLGGVIPGRVTTIDVAPNYNDGAGEVMVGVVDATATAGDAALGDVYIWGRNSVLNWVATALNEDVTTVAYSPEFTFDPTRLAISTTAAAGTRLHTLTANDAAWDMTLATVRVIDANIDDFFTAATGIVSSDIAFPSDFNTDLTTTRTCYVATVANGVNDNIYRLTVGANTPANVALSPGSTADRPFQSLAYSGTTAYGSLYAGHATSTAVWRTSNPTAAAGSVVWASALKEPTGGTSVCLALADDFSTSGMIYAGTTGAESALSVSDGGNYFYQAGLIDTTIAGINDFQVASASHFFMVTNDGGAGADSVWRTIDAGAKWYRMYSAVFVGNTGIIRPSPAYATDSTVYFGDVTSGAPGNIQVSYNQGVSWTDRASPIAVGDIAVKSQYGIYVSNSGAAATVQRTVYSNFTWQSVATSVVTGALTITDLEIDVGTGDLLVGLDNGNIYLSADNNATYTLIGTGIGGTNTIVSFDANYGSNDYIFAASAAGGIAGLSRFKVGTYTNWIACGSTVPVGAARDILVAPDGTLYISNATAGAAFSRSINPTIAITPTSLPSWDDAVSLGFDATATAGLLAMAEGSNVVYTIDTTNNRIYTYDDTLSTVSPDTLLPVEGSSVSAGVAPVTLTWEDVPGALTYRVRYDTRSDFLTAVTTTGGAGGTDPIDPTTSFTIGAGTLLNDADYYWQVRVQTPVVGPYSNTRTFVTQLAAAIINAPVILGTAECGTNAGGWNVSLTPTFQWGAIGGATGYEFQLATDFEMTDLVVNATGNNALSAVTAYELTSPTLDYNTTYFWQVRAISATSNTDWSPIIAFTTLAETAAPEPPLVVSTGAAPVIDMPPVPPDNIIKFPPAPEVQTVTPAYIWGIIIIGAILVAVVIVLIFLPFLTRLIPAPAALAGPFRGPSRRARNITDKLGKVWEDVAARTRGVIPLPTREAAAGEAPESDAISLAVRSFLYMTADAAKDGGESLLSAAEEKTLGKKLASGIKALAGESPLYLAYPRDAAQFLQIWSRYGSREETNRYLKKSFRGKPENALAFLKCYLPAPESKEADTAPKQEFTRAGYDALIQVIDADNVYEPIAKLLKFRFEKEEDKLQWDAVDRAVAYQFVRIHYDIKK